MTVAALVLYAAWFVLAFGVRTIVMLRRTGDSGFRGLSGRSGPLEVVAGVGFFVALLIGLAAPLADLAGLDPIAALDTPVVAGAGLALATAGVVLTLLAQLSMGTSWRIGVDPGERTALVTDGAFAVVRNPIFSAMLVTAIGLALMVPNVLSAVGLVSLLVALEAQVRGVEEPYLRRVHGDAYRRYESTVGRFVPRLGRTSH
ncbi:MAG TPA: isoprenylcysteine carboxylmethyltransferase family protein, partial [Acidimicrobiales bacterium]